MTLYKVKLTDDNLSTGIYGLTVYVSAASMTKAIVAAYKKYERKTVGYKYKTITAQSCELIQENW